MTSGEHPLRRPYSRELALGIAVAALAAWFLLGRDPAARGRGARAGSGVDSEGTQGDAASAVVLAPPEATGETASLRMPARDVSSERKRTDPSPAPRAEDGAPASAGQPGNTLEVLVLDGSNRPAPGVPVRIDVETTPPARGPGTAACTTGADGRAVFPLDTLPRAESLRAELRLRYVLHADVPLEQAPALDLGPTVPRAGLVTLHLPPVGRALVRVNAADGTPVAESATVYARVRTSTGSQRSCNATVRAGVAEFPWIDVGAELELRAVYDDQRTRASQGARARTPGPKWPGETVEFTLVLGPEWPLVTFRVLDERGRALAWANLDLLVSEETVSPQTSRCVVDGEGRGELRLLGEHRTTRERTLELALDRPLPRRALIVLPGELERTGATDLGTIVLRPSR